MEFDNNLLRFITSDFCELSQSDGGCKIGEGGFGPVFVAYLHHTQVAIKLLRLKNNDEFNKKMAKEQFNTEINVLTKYRHPNLVTLIGYSNPRDGSYPCLVYEFMKNGNLEDAIVPSRPHCITFNIRLDIVIDAACALVYLHMADPAKPLVHRDVKSANILLDFEYNAKVGDFGLARAVGRDNGGKTSKVMGTSGYIAPEYLHGEISEKIDVYAFGVVLMEVLTSQPSYDNAREKGPSLILYLQEKVADMQDVWKLHHKEAKWPEKHSQAVSTLAALCLEPRHIHRPTMEEVLATLKDIKRTKAGLEIHSEVLTRGRRPRQHADLNLARTIENGEEESAPVMMQATQDAPTPQSLDETDPNAQFNHGELTMGRQKHELRTYGRPSYAERGAFNMNGEQGTLLSTARIAEESNQQESDSVQYASSHAPYQKYNLQSTALDVGPESGVHSTPIVAEQNTSQESLSYQRQVYFASLPQRHAHKLYMPDLGLEDSRYYRALSQVSSGTKRTFHENEERRLHNFGRARPRPDDPLVLRANDRYEPAMEQISTPLSREATGN